MKKSINLIIIVLISASFINAESSKINKVLTIATPVNLLAFYLGYKLIKNGKKNKVFAEDVQNNPQKNLEAIRDYCANYKESHSVIGYSNGQAVTATVTNNNPSLFQTYINVKSDPEKLKDLAFLISKYMKDSSNAQIFAGNFIPLITLVGSVMVMLSQE